MSKETVEQLQNRGISRRSFIAAAAAGAAALPAMGAFTGCSSQGSAAGSDETSATESASAENQVIVVMPTTSEPSAGFDPLVSWGCGEHVHEPLIQSTLITTTADMDFENDLATSYESSADGLTWTFKIRSDVKFSDGEALTAADVAYTLNGIMTSELSECDLTMIASVEAPDDETVVLTLSKPFNAILYTLAVIGIVPAHAYGSDYGANPIGSGRYLLERWDKGQQAIFTANPDYYGNAPKMQRVVVLFKDEDASLASAKAGEADVAYTSATFAASQPSDYDLFTCDSVDSRGISLPTAPVGSPSIQTGGSAYEVGNNVTSDLAVRRAINYGIDRETLIQHVLGGYGQVAYSVCDGMPWASDDMRCDTDIDYAKQLLDSAGWTAGTDGIREKDGVRAQLTLYYSASDTVRQAIATEFAAQMKDLGIDVQIKGASWDDIYPRQFSDPIVWGWGSNSPLEFYNLTYSAGNGNYAVYQNDAVDAHIDAALAKPNVADSYSEWKLAQWDGENGVAPQGAATWVWFANVDHLYFVRPNLKIAQQKLHPHGHGWSLVNNVDEWEWA